MVGVVVVIGVVVDCDGVDEDEGVDDVGFVVTEWDIWDCES